MCVREITPLDNPQPAEGVAPAVSRVSLRDWNLRVFLRRITKSQRLRKQHWAVAIGLSAVEQKFWKIDADRVDIIDKPIAEFIGHLDAAVRDQLARTSAR